MVKKTLPNKRMRRSIRKHKDAVGVHKLIAQYEREIKSTPITSEADMLKKEIVRLKQLIKNNSQKEKLKASSILQDKPNISSSIIKKIGKPSQWVDVYQGGSISLKK